MSDERVLAVGFCPFCRESYEGVARCPAHDLALVSWDALPPESVEAAGESRSVAPSATAGRAWLIVASATMLAGFFMPVLVVDGTSTTGGLLAMEHAPNAWIIPACALATMAIALRRRTSGALHGARFVVSFFALVVLSSMAWTARAVLRGAALAQADVSPRSGAYVLAIAATAFLVAPLVLGRQVESGR